MHDETQARTDQGHHHKNHSPHRIHTLTHSRFSHGASMRMMYGVWCMRSSQRHQSAGASADTRAAARREPRHTPAHDCTVGAAVAWKKAPRKRQERAKQPIACSRVP